MTLEIGLAARVVAGIRTVNAQRTGCKEWEPAGIAAAMRACSGSPGSVLAAAALAAEDASLEKPSEVGFRNHWPVNAATTRRAPNTTPCGEEGHGDEPALGCTRCKAEREQAVAAGIHKAGAALVKAALAKAHAQPTPAQRRAAAQEAS